MNKLQDLPLTCSVPEFGKAAYDLNEFGSYAAANRGEIPTIRIGRLKRVPLRVALAPLAGESSIDEIIARFKTVLST